jgi:hypothetical protein
MKVKKDLQCVFNLPEKIKSEFDDISEVSHRLPPHAPVEVYPVDEYSGCPDNWMHGSDVASSYFLGVKEDYGMWLDFNECSYHTHDVAIVVSIQGVNPITGQKMVGENPLRLEQYHKKCPIHNIEYKQDRYCDECGFKWPGQNYLSTTGTPDNMLWLDGFRTPDGKVRQYVLTEDKMKGVASQMIGEDRVFAIGIAYYLSKNKKPFVPKRPVERPSKGIYGHAMGGSFQGFAQTNPMFFSPMHTPNTWNSGSPMRKMESSTSNSKSASNSSRIMMSIDENHSPVPDIVTLGDFSDSDNIVDNHEGTICSMSSIENMTRGGSVNIEPVIPVKKLEIGAGALINQRVYDDPKLMNYWEEEPAGMIYINYCDEDSLKKILDKGIRADKKDGFMQGINVGG